jgi:hypothetical protein
MGRQRLERIVRARRVEQPADQAGVDDGLAGVDPPERGLQRGDVGDTVLEQVADLLGALAQQHADVRMGRTDAIGGHEPLVGERGRHADVADHDVGRVGGDVAQQRLGIAHLRDDLEPLVGQQPRDAAADHHGIVSEHDAHQAGSWGASRATAGSSARSRVPAPGGLSIHSSPPTA